MAPVLVPRARSPGCVCQGPSRKQRRQYRYPNRSQALWTPTA